jgi:hypothetical protein
MRGFLTPLSFLTENQISLIDAGDFAGLRSLEFLHLKSNPIAHLPSDVFIDTPNLVFLFALPFAWLDLIL